MMIKTERLILRKFTPDDADAFAAMNADPQVMQYFPNVMSREGSDGFLEYEIQNWTDNGFSLFALEKRDTGEMIGFTGLSRPSYETPFTPCVEIGWRLVPSAWGKGLASEAAQASLAFGFAGLGLEEIVSFTTATNLPSQNLMKRIGMTRNPADDFDHPKLTSDHPLLRHVLYRLSREEWLATRAA